MYEAYIDACIKDSLKLADAGCGQGLRWFERYRKRHGIASVQEADREIFFRMYGREPNPHELQRVRFWRLQQHLPRNREEGILLGRALELTADELDLFLQQDLCSQRFTPVAGREELMEALFLQYLCRVPLVRLWQLNIHPGTQRRHMRHIFYTDALDCLAVDETVREHCYREHLYSRNFAAEFQKYRKPDTVISRENILRLLILLLLPDLDAGVLDGWLKRLGYAPLCPQGTVNGFVDFAVLRMLELCGRERSVDPETDKERMKKILSRYDWAVKGRIAAAERKKENGVLIKRLGRLRFMKFRSMDTIVAAGQGKGCKRRNTENG